VCSTHESCSSGAKPAIYVPVPSLLKWWKRFQEGMELSADASQSLSKCLEKHTNQWLTQDRHAQLNRHADPSLMDIYDTAKAKGVNINLA
jgi:post-segregation antitoxin (ccd killing protein)